MTAIGTIVQQIDELSIVVHNAECAESGLPECSNRVPTLAGGLSLRVFLSDVQREGTRRRHILEAMLSLEEPESLDDVLTLLMLGRDRLDMSDGAEDAECDEDYIIADRCFAAAVRGLHRHTKGHATKHRWSTEQCTWYRGNRPWPDIAAESEQEAAAILTAAKRKRTPRDAASDT